MATPHNRDRVDDPEHLYRRVMQGKGHYKLTDGQPRVSSSAFGDRNMRPSVDRAVLCGNDPSSSVQQETDAVLWLVAVEVRQIDLRQQHEGDSPEYRYLIDVVPRPMPENPAHAQIEPNPDYKTKSRFRKVLERLARLAENHWAILPHELRAEAGGAPGE